MANDDLYSDGLLTIEVTEQGGDVRMLWKGESNDREPGRFLVPILSAALGRSQHGSKRLVIDFSEIEYMNSSTFGPVVKLLDEAAKGNQHRVLVEYSKSRKWQTLSFSALRIFETPDGRITFSAK